MTSRRKSAIVLILCIAAVWLLSGLVVPYESSAPWRMERNAIQHLAYVMKAVSIAELSSPDWRSRINWSADESLDLLVEQRWVESDESCIVFRVISDRKDEGEVALKRILLVLIPQLSISNTSDDDLKWTDGRLMLQGDDVESRIGNAQQIFVAYEDGSIEVVNQYIDFLGICDKNGSVFSRESN